MDHDQYEGRERRGEERRGEGGLVLRAVDATQELLKTYADQEKERMRLIDSRIDDMQERMGAIVTLIDKYMETHNHILNAFPAGDIIGHKEAHESWLKESEERKQFWSKLKLELAKWGLVLFVGWIATQLWYGFIKELPVR